jgi:orotate phosphoribosyltransferase
MQIEPKAIDRLITQDILRLGHFAFTTGNHSRGLIDRDLVLTDPASASQFGYMLAKTFFTDRIDTIVTPSIWGAGLAYWIGYFLEPKATVVSATSLDDQLIIASKLTPLLESRRVLAVDNLILTGQTMSTLLGLLDDRGATIVGVATLWAASELQIGSFPVCTVLGGTFPAWPASECPLCAEGHTAVENSPY